MPDDPKSEPSDTVLLESRALSDRFVPLDFASRRAALHDLDVLDAPIEQNFRVLTELANALLETPVSLISLVTAERQFFVSSSGLAEPWATRRETPLSHSFCQHVVNRSEPLIVNDAREHPLVCDNLAIQDLGVAAYLGAPLIHEGNVLGSFCVIDDHPREWTKGNLEALSKLAALTVSELSNRKAAAKKQFELENRLRQSQKMEAIGQLTSGVAHDFNNVLWAIQIHADLLKREIGHSASATDHIEQIGLAVDSATGIVQQLLNWSRPGPSTAMPISLTQVVEDSLPLLKTALSPSVEILFRSDDGPGRIIAETNQIHQILLNLCSNANHAMRESGGQIVVSVTTLDLNDKAAENFGETAGRFVLLTVSDQGHGIPTEFLDRIHDPYFTTKPVGEGTGLGLWTVFGIVRRHNAKIRVDSVTGQGTTFKILFPASKLQTGNATATMPTEQIPLRGASEKILVVDDETIIAEGLAQRLSIEGYDVAHFSASPAALEFFLNEPTAVDIVITDRSMPVLHGDKLVQRIKSVRPSLPVIVCSGYVTESKVETDPADAHCLKPIDCRKLCDIIEMLLEKDV